MVGAMVTICVLCDLSVDISSLLYTRKLTCHHYYTQNKYI